MALTKEKKGEIIEDVKTILDDSQSVVFVNFHGLSVEHSTQLRRNLREKGVGYRVTKKTLIRRALDSSGTEGDIPTLEGELAIAYGEDLTIPANEVYSFQKQHKESLSIIGGIFEGRYMDQAEMMEIATIPPVPVLRGMFVNLINSPIQRIVIALDKIAEKKA